MQLTDAHPLSQKIQVTKKVEFYNVTGNTSSFCKSTASLWLQLTELERKFETNGPI